MDGCLAVVEPGGTDESIPLFPAGTVVESGEEGPVVRTPVGAVRVSSTVGLGGGFIGGLGRDLEACTRVAPSGGFSVVSINGR